MKYRILLLSLIWSLSRIRNFTSKHLQFSLNCGSVYIWSWSLWEFLLFLYATTKWISFYCQIILESDCINNFPSVCEPSEILVVSIAEIKLWMQSYPVKFVIEQEFALIWRIWNIFWILLIRTKFGLELSFPDRFSTILNSDWC